MVFIGIDVGTQGVRGIAADENGRILSGAHREYKNVNLAPADKIAEGWREQDPNDWWAATCAVLEDMGRDIDIKHADTICVDGTSGTIAAIDERGEPIGNALMYNDARGNGGKGIPKILWLKEHRASACRIHRFVHQADFIVGRLTGQYGITDWSNALKSGYDIREGRWSEGAQEAFSTDAGARGSDTGECAAVPATGESAAAPVSGEGAAVSASVGSTAASSPDTAHEYSTVPRVVPVGTPIGKWNDVTVVAGASDGYMSAVATCAVKPGEWASIIGTTLVLKGVTKNYIDDPTGCVYCHKHPEGYWMPGGASNVGARCINEWFIPSGVDMDSIFHTLNSRVLSETPTGALEYPLLAPGERFPFLDKEFKGFGAHDNYTAVIEGISYVERLCFEKLEELGCDVGDTIYATGGACRSDEWLQLRANILGKSIKVPEVTDAAIGGAMLGAAAVHYVSLAEAADHMGRFAKIVAPDISETDRHRYDEIYASFKAMIEKTR